MMTWKAYSDRRLKKLQNSACRQSVRGRASNGVSLGALTYPRAHLTVGTSQEWRAGDRNGTLKT